MTEKKEPKEDAGEEAKAPLSSLGRGFGIWLMNLLRDLKWAGLEGAVTTGAVVRRDDAQRKQILIGQVVDVPATAGRAGQGRYSHGLVVRLR
jgi:hypothetical protein